MLEAQEEEDGASTWEVLLEKFAVIVGSVLGTILLSWLCMPNCFLTYICCFVPPFLEQPDKYWKEEIKRLKAREQRFTEVAAADVPQGFVDLELKLPQEV